MADEQINSPTAHGESKERKQEQRKLLQSKFASVLKKGLFHDFVLRPLVISNCNATGPYCFSRATVQCEFSPLDDIRSVVFFFSGFRSISEALRGDKITTQQEKEIENFLNHIGDLELKHLKCLRLLLKYEKKTEAMVRNSLSVHYFHPLAYDSDCIVDIGSSNVCAFCKETVRSGDTSLGHPKVWHGRTDVIIKNSSVKIASEPDTDDDDDDGDDLDHASGEPAAKLFKEEKPTFSSIIEVKLKASPMALEQALAEGIVNAFCEVRKKTSLSKKFIPSFFATEEFIRIIMYNVDKDILLLSDQLKLWAESEDMVTETLNTSTLLHVWLALNFDHFEIDNFELLEKKLEEKLLTEKVSSNFRKFVGEGIYSIYSKNVSKPMESHERIELIKRSSIKYDEEDFRKVAVSTEIFQFCFAALKEYT